MIEKNDRYRILSQIIIAITSFLYLPRISGLYIRLSHTARRDIERCQRSSESSISASTLHTGTFVSIKVNRTLCSLISVIYLLSILFYSFIFLRVLLRVSLLIRWKNTKWEEKSLINVCNPNIGKRKYMPHHYKLHSYCIFRPNRNIWKGTQISRTHSTFVWTIFPVPFGT